MAALAWMLVVATLVALAAVVYVVQQRRRIRFIEEYEFPPPLTFKLRKHHPQLGEHEVEQVFEGLRQWFVACADAKGKMIGMPSRVVDDAWHEFILMTRRYHAFCNSAFGHYLHHAPNAMSEEPVAPTIPRTLELVERRTAVRPELAALAPLPTLFTVDAELGIDEGQTWTRELVELQRTAPTGSGCLGVGERADKSDGGCGGDCGGCGGCGCGG
jgi:hypothetical protein